MQRCLFFGCVAGFFLLIMAACGKNTTPTPTVLSGTWIEASGRGDTLIFEPEVLEVRRGFEIRNGLRLPKTGSGLWSYQVGEKYQMEVRPALSSSMKTQTAYAELKDNSLYISNFYEPENTKHELRAFNRK